MKKEIAEEMIRDVHADHLSERFFIGIQDRKSDL